MKIFYNGQRIDAEARFTNRRKQLGRGIDQTLKKLTYPTIGILVITVLFSWGKNAWENRTILSYVAPEAEAATIPEEFKGLSVEQLEAKLDEIVWGIESGDGVGKGITMEEGEIFQTFDPPQSWIDDGTVAAKCFKTGGKINQECYSFGPRQIKIPTLQTYWQKLHGETLSDKEARDIAESNDGSRRFFLDCAEKIQGCADNWTSFRKHRTEGQIYLNLIREIKGITV